MVGACQQCCPACMVADQQGVADTSRSSIKASTWPNQSQPYLQPMPVWRAARSLAALHRGHRCSAVQHSPWAHRAAVQCSTAHGRTALQCSAAQPMGAPRVAFAVTAFSDGLTDLHGLCPKDGQSACWPPSFTAAPHDSHPLDARVYGQRACWWHGVVAWPTVADTRSWCPSWAAHTTSSVLFVCAQSRAYHPARLNRLQWAQRIWLPLRDELTANPNSQLYFGSHIPIYGALPEPSFTSL